MNSLWLVLNIFFAIWGWNSATDEVKEKSIGIWFFYLFLSAWNTATVANVVL